VRFPVWHRVYLRFFEAALQKAANVPIPLPYLDWMSLVQDGAPAVLTQPTWIIDGTEQPNPLWNYEHDRELVFNEGTSNCDFTTNTTTNRFPFVSNFGGDQTKATSYNSKYKTNEVPNVVNNHFRKFIPSYDIATDFHAALSAKSYKEFVFIDGAHNRNALEVGHDSGHGLIGYGDPDNTIYSGDMGDPNTAAFDPIFWLHHCFVDYVLDAWWNSGNTISASDFGSSVVLPFPVNTNIPVFGSSNSWSVTDDLLAMLKANEGVGYEGSLNDPGFLATIPVYTGPPRKVHVYSVNRIKISGAFTVYAKNSTTGDVLDKQFIFNRIEPEKCANCVANPNISFSLEFVEQPYNLTYSLAFHGTDEQPAPPDIFKLVSVTEDVPSNKQ